MPSPRPATFVALLRGINVGGNNALEARIERALSKAHGYDARVVLRSHDEMKQHVADLPRAWKRPDPKMRYAMR